MAMNGMMNSLSGTMRGGPVGSGGPMSRMPLPGGGGGPVWSDRMPSMPPPGQQMPATNYPPPTMGATAPPPDQMRQMIMQLMQRGAPMSRPMR